MLTKDWEPQGLRIDTLGKAWELQGTGKIGSMPIMRSVNITSEELIPLLSHDAATVQAVFDEIVSVLMGKIVENTEAELSE